jgi:CBS-domain-containing membrane protein
MKRLLAKMVGGAKSPPRAGVSDVFWSAIGGFVGIGAVAFLDYRFASHTDMVMMLGSFGASAVLVFGAVKSPLSQPRNVFGGHVISALVGVFASNLLPEQTWLAAPLAVAASIALMHVTKTLHPPGGATALIAIIGSSKIRALGYLYVAMPVGAGAAILLAVALVVNNIPHDRRYPEFWF